MSLNVVSNVGVNIQEKATVIWNVADMLRGPFKPHEYGLVILPMTVVKRFNDCLLSTHNAVQETYQKVKDLAVIDGFLTKASGYQFYNTSKFTFDSLVADPENIEANFRDYLAGFSPNIQDILAKFDFDNIIKRMVESNTLYLVIREFNSTKGYLGPDKISAVDCGYIFEDLVKRFSESYGEEAGTHFTSRDIIYLMTDILLNEADLTSEGNVTVYDMTMGTSQMLSCMEERIHAINKDIEVTCFGQEFNPSTFAIAKADMMIRGGDPNNMRYGDTLSDDQFSGYTFKYCISNPPFGIDWKREQKAVEAEAKQGDNGRFGAGLPKISDGQQLFVLSKGYLIRGAITEGKFYKNETFVFGKALVEAVNIEEKIAIYPRIILQDSLISLASQYALQDNDGKFYLNCFIYPTGLKHINYKYQILEQLKLNKDKEEIKQKIMWLVSYFNSFYSSPLARAIEHPQISSEDISEALLSNNIENSEVANAC